MYHAGSQDSAVQPVQQGSELCLSCGLCCDGTLHGYITITSEEASRVARLGLPIHTVADGGSSPQPCACHQDGRCTIYPDRPTACRTYQCKLLKKYLQGRVNLKESQEVVNKVHILLAPIREHLAMTNPTQGVWQTVEAFWDSEAYRGDPTGFRQANAGFLLDLAALRAFLHRHFAEAPVEQGRSAKAYLLESLRDPKDASSVLRFLIAPNPKTPFLQRLSIVVRLYAISAQVPCPHRQYEILAFIASILAIPQHIAGCIVEAGCYKGGSTAKFSIAAALAGRRLIVFDSFSGLPTHEEPFPAGGSYCGTLDEVQDILRRLGKLEACEFIKGWFDVTMPSFSMPIAAAFLDVDLASSTRTCLKYLYPLLISGGTLYSHDGHLPPVVRVFEDDAFWKHEVSYPRPRIERLGKRLIKITKPDPPLDKPKG